MPENPFWNFSLNRYRRDGVPPLCLALQDKHGADMNLVLFSLWLGAKNLSIRQGAVTNIFNSVQPWHSSVVTPMRNVRRWLKGRDIMDTAGRDQLRASIQKLEIEAEKLEQDMLFTFFENTARTFFENARDPAIAMTENARLFCRLDAEQNTPDFIIAKLVALCLYEKNPF